MLKGTGDQEGIQRGNSSLYRAAKQRIKPSGVTGSIDPPRGTASPTDLFYILFKIALKRD